MTKGIKMNRKHQFDFHRKTTTNHATYLVIENKNLTIIVSSIFMHESIYYFKEPYFGVQVIIFLKLVTCIMYFIPFGSVSTRN